MCQACNLVQLADNILRFFVVAGAMAVALMFAYAGFLYVTAAGNKGNLESAHKIFWNSLIGLIIILTSFLIVDMTIRLATGQSLNVLTQVSCVRTEITATGFSYTRVPGDNPVTAETGGGGGPVDNTNYCSEAELPGFSAMIGDAIDRYGSNLTNGAVPGIEEYCPNYASMTPEQRKGFWTRYMQGVAQRESGCRSNGTPFPETTLGIDSVTGLPVVSEGLFQLSYGSERGRARTAPDGVCYFDPARQDIRDAQKNTACAIFILNQDLGSQGSFNGATRYWSVSRSKRAELIAVTRDVPGCR